MKVLGKRAGRSVSGRWFRDNLTYVSLVRCDTDFCRRFYENKSVKKTLSIPMWLNERAERANVNFSGILQEALKAYLHIQE
jgi:hypothetical protein